MPRDKHVYSRTDLEFKWNCRWRARLDRIWFANEVLGYPDICEKVHGPVAARLMTFPKPTRETARESDKILDTGRFEYTPWNDPYKLPGSRRTLILDPRGSMKTTFNTIVDTLYWIINYPHLRYATIFSTSDKAQDVIKNALEFHFKFNQKFMELFPELCPTKRVADWGTAEAFTVEGLDELLHRLKRPPRVEPTVRSLSIDKTGTGYHFDMIKCSDVVEPTNVRTPSERDNVKSRVALMPRILVVPEGWLYLEGTFYHPADLYGDLVRDWIKKDEEKAQQNWSIFIRSAFKREMGGEEPTFTPADMRHRKLAVDAAGKEISFWPERFTWEELNRSRTDPTEGPMFASQLLLDLSMDESSNRPFQVPPSFVSRSAFEKIPKAYNLTTVDLADTTGIRSNHSVITTAAFDRMGRCYVHDIRRGKFTPEQTIDILFEVNEKHQPLKIFVEDYGYVHGLRPSIERKSALTGKYPPFHFHPRERKANEKVTRIVRALQPVMANGDLKFVDPLDTTNSSVANHLRTAVETEFSECTVSSTGNSDDILDTLADLYLCREYFGPEGLRGGALQQEAAARAMLQLEQYRHAQKEMLFGKDPTQAGGGFAW